MTSLPTRGCSHFPARSLHDKKRSCTPWQVGIVVLVIVVVVVIVVLVLVVVVPVIVLVVIVLDVVLVVELVIGHVEHSTMQDDLREAPITTSTHRSRPKSEHLAGSGTPLHILMALEVVFVMLLVFVAGLLWVSLVVASVLLLVFTACV